MKVVYRLFGGLLLSVLLSSAVFADDYTGGLQYWKIADYHTVITVNPDSSLQIEEYILADFSNEPHKGIVRSLPYVYTVNNFGTRKIHISDISSTDEKGNPWLLEISKSNGYIDMQATTKDMSQLTEKATYDYKYKAENVINYFEDHDELYWDVIGTEWAIPIEKSSAEIIIPQGIAPEDVSYECYTGFGGESNKDCDIQVTEKNGNTVVELSATKSFAPYEGMTIVVGVPPGTLAKPSLGQRITNSIQAGALGFLPIPVLIGMLLLWYYRGRDPKVKNSTIIPHYTPPKNLTALECGCVLDEKLDNLDITAGILTMAIKGYIKIAEIETGIFIFKGKDYELSLEKEYKDKGLPEFETLIMDSIFEYDGKLHLKVKLSDLKNTFHKHVKEIETSVMEKLTKENYFPKNPVKARKIYGAVGIATVILTIFFSETISILTGYLSLVGIAISGIIIIVFGNFMSRKTVLGKETHNEIKGLKEYINTAEKDRIEFQENANIFFEKLLPYATIFKLTKKWAKAFDGLMTEPPSWYTSFNERHTIIMFADSLDSFANSSMHAFSSNSSSGGSGFGGGSSGGGFGGGGGRGV